MKGLMVPVTAAVAKGLPVSVLLGTDVPELGQLLHSNPMAVHSGGTEQSLVTTRAQSKMQIEGAEKEARGEEQSDIPMLGLSGGLGEWVEARGSGWRLGGVGGGLGEWVEARGSGWGLGGVGGG